MAPSKSSLSDPPSLPHDLIIEILSRLPVRSLVAFCCVCKSWKNLMTSDRFFARFHLRKNSTNNRNDKNYRRARKNAFIKPISAIECSTNTETRVKSIARELNYACDDSRSYRLIFAKREFKLAGCCDGILCFYFLGHGSDTNLTIYLCNPALNQYRVLPKGNFQSKTWYPSLGTKVCFMLDPTSEDHKVIIIGNCLVEIYSLNSNSWRGFIIDITNPGYHIQGYSDIVVHNGSPCWLTESAGDAKNKVLNVLDITQDQIRVIPLPKLLSAMRYPSLQRYKGSVAISSCSYSSDELWVMKEDNAGDDSWVKQVIGSNSTFLTSSAPFSFFIACGIIIYRGDVENERFEECTDPSQELLHGFSSEFFIAVDYVPSLISIMLPTQPNSSNY